MTNLPHYTEDPTTVGSPFSYIRVGTVFLTTDGRTVTVISIGRSCIWTVDGQFAWGDLDKVVTR